MRFFLQLTLLTLMCGMSTSLAGCAVRGSSFETLGVPTPENRAGHSPVILGWALEERSGWMVQRLQVDSSARSEWNEDTQQPVILYLEPGEHEFALSTAQLSDPRDMSSRPRRRYRVRPFRVELMEGEAQLCVIRLSGERHRPQVSCEAHDYGDQEEEEYLDEYGDENAEIAEDGEAPAPEAEEASQEEPAAPQPTPTRPTTAQPTAESESASSEGAVPSPFGPTPSVRPPAQTETPAAQPTQPAAQPTQPAAQPTQPAAQPTQPAAQPTQPARRLSQEERIERLERLVEELRRQIREE